MSSASCRSLACAQLVSGSSACRDEARPCALSLGFNERRELTWASLTVCSPASALGGSSSRWAMGRALSCRASLPERWELRCAFFGWVDAHLSLSVVLPLPLILLCTLIVPLPLSDFLLPLLVLTILAI